jgi:Arc/MetJ family transcription regulator
MRTTIDIDEALLKRAMKASGVATKTAAVEKALALLVHIDGQKAIHKLRGKIKWQVDIDALRRD